MAGWPISISEAARRLDVPFTTASILIRTHEIETVSSASQTKYKGLMPEAYEQLRAKAAPFVRAPRPRVAVPA